jgi:hypothetical protein
MAASQDDATKNKLEGSVCARAEDKVIERRERCVNQEEAIGRELTLVAQEIKAKQEPHYHDNEKQRKSDNVTDIHDGRILELTNHPALSTVNFFGFF